MQKVPALLKLRYGKDEKNVTRNCNSIVAIVNKPEKICILLAKKEDYDRLYKIVDYDKRGQAKTYI